MVFDTPYLLWGIIGAVLCGAIQLLGVQKKIFRAVISGAVIGWLLGCLLMAPIRLFSSEAWLILFILICWGNTLRLIEEDEKKLSGWSFGGKFLSSTAIITGGFLALVIITSSPLLWSESYRNLAKVETVEFGGQVDGLDQTKPRMVRRPLARKTAKLLLGDERFFGLGSQFKIGPMQAQIVNGEPIWVGPLDYIGFLKWLDNDHTPGYVTVSQTNSSESELIKRKLLISEEAWFSNNISRFVHKHFWVHTVQDAEFEIDEQGNPYWIVPLTLPNIGAGGHLPVKWVIVNPINREWKAYDSADELPTWVDRVYPEEVMYARLSDWGAYVDGFWNSILAENEVLSPTAGMTLVPAANGRLVFYTGVQFANNSENQDSTAGFAFIDTRSGNISFFRRAGLTETAAIDILEGGISNYNYHVDEVVMYEHEGEPVFFGVLKDNSGNPKRIGIASQKERKYFGIGAFGSLREALRNYDMSISSDQGGAILSEIAQFSASFQGKVWRKIDRNGLYFLILDSVPNRVFVVDPSINNETLMTQVGDEIKVTTNDTGSVETSVHQLDNLELEFELHPDEIVALERREVVQESRQEDIVDRALERTLPLTAEEKASILNTRRAKENN